MLSRWTARCDLVLVPSPRPSLTDLSADPCARARSCRRTAAIWSRRRARTARRGGRRRCSTTVHGPCRCVQYPSHTHISASEPGRLPGRCEELPGARSRAAGRARVMGLAGWYLGSRRSLPRCHRRLARRARSAVRRSSRRVPVLLRPAQGCSSSAAGLSVDEQAVARWALHSVDLAPRPVATDSCCDSARARQVICCSVW